MFVSIGFLFEQGKHVFGECSALTAPRSTVVQPGPVHSGLTADPAAELTHLFDTLVQPRAAWHNPQPGRLGDCGLAAAPSARPGRKTTDYKPGTIG